MADDIERYRESVEQLGVSIAEHHPLPVPKSVVVLLAVMDRGIERQTLVVDRVPLIILKKEIEGVTEPVISLIDRNVAG
jgi:hypothetical protein